MQLEKFELNPQLNPISKKDKGHRRTQSNSNYDFRQFNTLHNQKENDKNFKNMMDIHQILDKNHTKEVLEEETRKQSTSQDKHVVVENIEPTFQELNRYNNVEKNFFNFGKKNRNLTTIFGENSEVLKELDINDLSNRKKSRKSIHEVNPAKKYERELMKEEKFFVIPEQNDLLLSTEFPNNKINLKKEEQLKEKTERVEEKMETKEHQLIRNCQADEKKDDVNINSSDSKAEHFQSLMYLKSNILKAMAKTNNRYNSKEEIKTSRGVQFKTLKENSTIKAKKNSKNCLTINLMNEKPKFSTTTTLNFNIEKEKFIDSMKNDIKNACKHKKNSVSSVTKKDVSFSSLKKSEKLEKDFSKLETQVSLLRKKVDLLENQNKCFKYQLTVISEEKNIYMKVSLFFFFSLLSWTF